MQKGADMYQEMLVNYGMEEAEYSVQQKTLLIQFHADVDHHNAGSIRTKADRLIARGGLKNIVFDFEGVHFMDSSGIGMIMGRYKQVVFQGGKIAACGVGSEVDRILTMSGLYRVMEKYECARDAVEALNQKRGGR